MTKFEQDKIGRKEIVNRICLLVDNLQKDQHFCLALDGDWGSGKSFVLDMVEEKLEQHREYVIIKYDAWANSFYSDPLIAILSCLIDGIQEKLKEIKGYNKAIKELAKEKGTNLLEELSQKTGKLGTVASIIKAIIGVIPKFQNAYSFEENNNISDFKSYQQLLMEIKDNLNALTAYREYRGKQTKLIILVDEIDRCLPDEQLKVLERLHHLFEVKNCAVICAVNKKGIIKNFEITYGGNGEEYLRKFFDFNFYLDMSAEGYMQRLLEEFSENLAKVKEAEKTHDIPCICAQMCMGFGEKKVLKNIDNREVQRYYDCLIKVCNDFGWERLPGPPYVFFIIVALFIRKNISNTFLDETEIKIKQKVVDEWFANPSIEREQKKHKMPYHDYVKEHLGINRENFPKEFLQLWQGQGINICAELIWYFNEIVCYSTGKEFQGNSLRVFYGHPAIDGKICQELRKLIILYGGGEQK